MKCIRRTAKYTWQDYKTNEDILSELKFKLVVKKTQNYRNKCAKHVRRMDTDRLTHLIMKYQPRGKGSQGRTPKDFSTVNGIGTGHVA
jgi:hypothetical protein